MSLSITRRAALAGVAALVPLTRARATTQPNAEALRAASARIAAIETQDGGRLGVFVLDTGTGAHLAHRAEERFPMCSTFKFLAATAVLKRVDAGQVRLDQKILYGPSDLLSYAPVTKAHVAEGGMRLGALCAAAIEWSDNTAANLLLGIIGGPPALTHYVRTLGDTVTRLDRTEPTLNTAIPGDPRDTTSPRAMLNDMQTILLGEELSSQSRQQLQAWMIADKVSGKRIRAGLPATWRAGDKTGTGGHGTANTIAILWPPGRAPILATVYYTGSSAAADVREAAHARIGRIIAGTF